MQHGKQPHTQHHPTCFVFSDRSLLLDLGQTQVEAKLQALQQQRVQQLAPSRLYLPIPWQPVVYEQPVTMFKASVPAAAEAKAAAACLPMHCQASATPTNSKQLRHDSYQPLAAPVMSACCLNPSATASSDGSNSNSHSTACLISIHRCLLCVTCCMHVVAAQGLQFEGSGDGTVLPLLVRQVLVTSCHCMACRWLLRKVGSSPQCMIAEWCTSCKSGHTRATAAAAARRGHRYGAVCTPSQQRSRCVAHVWCISYSETMRSRTALRRMCAEPAHMF